MDSENQDTPQEIIDTWALVELFGHNKIAGQVKTVSLLGAPFIRVDVPDVAEQKGYTRFLQPEISLQHLTDHKRNCNRNGCRMQIRTRENI